MNPIAARCLLLFFLTLPYLSQAGIQLDSTRVIYPAGKREVTLAMTNHAETPRLIQAWVDNGDTDISPQKNTAPFIVMPPIFRLDPEKGQTLRIIFTGGNVPQDRESVFWLNVLEIQPKQDASKTATNAIKVSIRIRLKLFYRPPDLPGSPKDAETQLRWRVVEGGLECENPSAFNVSISDIWFWQEMESTENKHNDMCPAKGKKIFPIQQKQTSNNNIMFFSTINDYGAHRTNKSYINN